VSKEVRTAEEAYRQQSVAS